MGVVEPFGLGNGQDPCFKTSSVVFKVGFIFASFEILDRNHTQALSPLLLDSKNPCMVYFMIFLYHLE